MQRTNKKSGPNDSEMVNGIQTYYAKIREEWRKWLEHNGQSEKSVWFSVTRKRAKPRALVSMKPLLMHFVSE